MWVKKLEICCKELELATRGNERWEIFHVYIFLFFLKCECITYQKVHFINGSRFKEVMEVGGADFEGFNFT